MEIDAIYTAFVNGLKKLYGDFDADNKKFGKAPNSQISRDLGYSDAQFSRLINASATEGEYQRAIQNLERILTVSRLENEIEKNKKPINWKQHSIWFFISIALVLALLYISTIESTPIAESSATELNGRDHTLKWTFESSFINPYVKLDDLPDDCNYPCYKYQGKWELKEMYKIPFFRERSGFHYLATEVHTYARCMSEESESGDVLEGFEYQKHEIWYDKREWPVDSFMTVSRGLKESYEEMNFQDQHNFIKVADVHTFFRNEFTIEDTIIYRTGKVIGRDMEFVSEADLNDIVDNPNMVQELREELNLIASNKLEDFSKPVDCLNATVRSDFHSITNGDVMSFSCNLTTSRLAMNYVKTYELTDQYIKNTCR